MWYLLIIFILVFEGTFSFAAPHIPNLTIDADSFLMEDLRENVIDEAGEIDSVVDLVDVGLNAGLVFVGLMTFQINGLESISFVFWFLDIILFICIVVLIKPAGGI